MNADNLTVNPDALLTETEALGLADNWRKAAAANALLTETDAAALTGLSVRTLQTWRVRGGGPQFAKLGGAVRYRRADIEAWINARLARTTGEAEARK